MDVTLLEVYCLNPTCGDPVPSVAIGTEPPRTRRRMQFSGAPVLSSLLTFGLAFEYWCPVCGSVRHFTRRMFGTGFVELRHRRM